MCNLWLECTVSVQQPEGGTRGVCGGWFDAGVRGAVDHAFERKD